MFGRACLLHLPFLTECVKAILSWALLSEDPRKVIRQGAMRENRISEGLHDIPSHDALLQRLSENDNMTADCANSRSSPACLTVWFRRTSKVLRSWGGHDTERDPSSLRSRLVKRYKIARGGELFEMHSSEV